MIISHYLTTMAAIHFFLVAFSLSALSVSADGKFTLFRCILIKFLNNFFVVSKKRSCYSCCPLFFSKVRILLVNFHIVLFLEQKRFFRTWKHLVGLFFRWIFFPKKVVILKKKDAKQKTKRIPIRRTTLLHKPVVKSSPP